MYALTWHIKHVGNKLWSGSNERAFERWHEIWLRKNMYYLWSDGCYGTLFVYAIMHKNLYKFIYIYILNFISMFIEGRYWRDETSKSIGLTKYYLK